MTDSSLTPGGDPAPDLTALHEAAKRFKCPSCGAEARRLCIKGVFLKPSKAGAGKGRPQTIAERADPPHESRIALARDVAEAERIRAAGGPS